MLQVVTETALLRRWPPQLFVRLCNQLQDTPDQTSGAAQDLLDIVQSPHIPLLYEYILQLALDSKSILPLEKLLRIWSEEKIDERTDATKGLMSYLAKGFQDLTTFDDPVTVADSILGLAQQGKNGSLESDFVVSSLGKSPVAPQILRNVPTLASDLRNIDISYANAFGPSRVQEGNQKFAYTPGRTFRLLWLDEFISNCVLFPGNQLFSEQLDILWPNEKTSTLAFELALTAFDAYASALTLQNRVSIWEQFVGKKLPLILRYLANSQPLDNALTRLLTTMDKEVAAAVDQKDVRLNFTRTCIDLGLCDSSVLHALHRDYQPHPENLDTILDIPTKEISRQLASTSQDNTSYPQSLVVRLVEALPDLKPLALETVAKELHKFVRNPRASLKHLSWLSIAFLNSINSCDALSMYVPIKSILDHLVKRLETVSQTETQINTQFYGEIGSILMFVKLLLQRYDILITAAEQQSSWAYKQLFQEPSLISNFEDMTPQIQGLLGSWINALAGGRGITDECLRPPVETFEIFPALIKQLVLAYQDKVITLDTLKMSLDYFLQPHLALCLTLILRTVLYNIWAQLNSEGNLEVLKHLLTGIEGKSASPEFRAVINIAAPLFEQFSNFNIKASDVERLISKLVARAQPLTFSKIEIKGSFVAAFQSTMKGIVQWQTEPVGIPVVDSRLFEMGIKYFGTEEMMKLAIENVDGTPETKMEVQVAIVVLYCSRLVKRVNSTNLVPSGVCSNLITEIATEYVNKFHAIYEKHMDVVEELPVDDEPDASIFNVPQTNDILVTATEPLLEHDSSFNYGFDMDVSAPMGMDELDDAMNLDYFQ